MKSGCMLDEKWKIVKLFLFKRFWCFARICEEELCLLFPIQIKDTLVVVIASMA